MVLCAEMKDVTSSVKSNLYTNLLFNETSHELLNDLLIRCSVQKQHDASTKREFYSSFRICQHIDNFFDYRFAQS